MLNNSYYGNFRTRTFSDIWPAETNFLQDYDDSGLRVVGNSITNDSVEILFYLLFAEYGGSHIASSDETQFKYQVFSTIFKYGPTWERQLDIQAKLRALTDEDISTGNRQIFNKALNPGTEPSTEELDYVSEQTVAKYARGKIESYAALNDILKADVSQTFVKQFKKYFLQIVMPERPLWYENTIDEEVEY